MAGPPVTYGRSRGASSARGASAGPGLGWFVSAVLLLAALMMLVFGLWAFVAPAPFARTVAPWATLGEHFLRDAGAFQVGIGVAVATAVVWRDSVLLALTGFSVASGFHSASHLIDADLVGFTGLLALFVLGVAAMIVRARNLRHAERRGAPPVR